MLDVVALGELLIDFTPAGNSEKGMDLYECNPGGAPANVLAVLSRLKKSTAFIGKVGDDGFGVMLKNTLEKIGVGTDGLILEKAANTTITFVKLDADGNRNFMFYRKPGADVLLSIEEVKLNLIDNSKIFHYGSVSMTDEPSRTATLEAAAYAKKQGKLITYDPNLRRLLWNDENEAKELIFEGMKYADVLKISEEELEFLTDTKDLSIGTSYLLDKFSLKLIFVTLGADGCYFRSLNGMGSVSGFDIKAIDTTGAGDAFFGGVIYKLLEINKNITDLTSDEIRSITCFGNAVGELATTKKGAITIMPDLEQIEDLISK